MADLFEKLPAELQSGPEAQLLRPVSDHKFYNIVHLIYRARNYEGHSKDYDFSRAPACRSTGVPVITTPSAHCAIQKCLSGLRTRRAYSPLISTVMAANRTATPTKRGVSSSAKVRGNEMGHLRDAIDVKAPHPLLEFAVGVTHTHVLTHVLDP
jgi:hypothetical protein